MSEDERRNQGIFKDFVIPPELLFWVWFAMLVLAGLLYLATLVPFSFFPQ